MADRAPIDRDRRQIARYGRDCERRMHLAAALPDCPNRQLARHQAQLDSALAFDLASRLAPLPSTTRSSR